MEDYKKMCDYSDFLRSVNADSNTVPDNSCEQAEERAACDELIESCRKMRVKSKPHMKLAGRSEGRRYYSRC